ncbi:TlpA family protein disulfide reductase [Georgenia sp. Z1344]|uniref:TlpA family protein disulfide reductase n=1 Tax=Georgenia sp. Z1344 TaxID=3416706 RepID=UPI003CF1A099
MTPRTSRTRSRTVPAALGALALAGSLAACAPSGSSPDGGDVGAGYEAGDGSFTTWDPDERGDAIELTGTSYDEQPVDLADARGGVAVVNFWYAACPPCRVEAPDLAEMAADYEGEVVMLGVNPRDDTATAQAFENTFEIPYPSVHDSEARAVAAFEGLVPLSAMPTTVVLDQEGRVAARILGQADPTILRGLVDDVLAEA